MTGVLGYLTSGVVFHINQRPEGEISADSSIAVFSHGWTTRVFHNVRKVSALTPTVDPKPSREEQRV